MAARLGVDIGGTFTDLVVIDETTGAARVGKILTTPKDPAHGVEQGIASLLEESRTADRLRPRGRARHDAGHQRAHRAQGRAHGAL